MAGEQREYGCPRFSDVQLHAAGGGGDSIEQELLVSRKLHLAIEK